MNNMSAEKQNKARRQKTWMDYKAVLESQWETKGSRRSKSYVTTRKCLCHRLLKPEKHSYQPKTNRLIRFTSSQTTKPNRKNCNNLEM
uniref:Uncharacterized protein n=1 Tax=Romanomermis culicivorax TaxID=13658 RepID=A0A915KYW9_ROMCU